MPSLSTALTDRLDFLAARQGVIAGNIANADTPGYLAKDLTFKSAMANAAQVAPVSLATTNGAHFAIGAADSQTGSSQATTSARFVQQNGNAVKLDQEMLKQQDAQMNYRYMTQLYTTQMKMQMTALGKGS